MTVAAEFLGTFTLVFCGAGACVIDHVTHGGVTHVGVGFTFGLIVMALIYSLGDISGAHFNPAVTLGFVIGKQFSVMRAMPYIVAQILGAIAASAAHRAIFGNVANLGATLPATGAGASFILEIILTAILMFVILCVSSGPKEVGIMAGIAIGGVVGLEAIFAGPISGASMNPARSIGPALMSGHLDNLWIYLVAPVLGAAIAVPCWMVVRSGNPDVIGDSTCPKPMP